MTVYNWIETRFADGVDFVSDAPEDVAQAISGTLSSLGEESGFRFTETPVPESDLRVVSLLWSHSGGRFAHAVALPGAEAQAGDIEALFARRYGLGLQQRLEGLVERLAELRVEEAALALTDLFIRPEDIEPPATSTSTSPSPSPPLTSLRRRLAFASPAPLPWLVAIAAVAAAAFVSGRLADRPSAPPALPPVSAPPPRLEERVSALESDVIVFASLREQLSYQRRLHAEELEAKELALRALTEKLERSAAAPARAPVRTPPGRRAAAREDGADRADVARRRAPTRRSQRHLVVRPGGGRARRRRGRSTGARRAGRDVRAERGELDLDRSAEPRLGRGRIPAAPRQSESLTYTQDPSRADPAIASPPLSETANRPLRGPDRELDSFCSSWNRTAIELRSFEPRSSL